MEQQKMNQQIEDIKAPSDGSILSRPIIIDDTFENPFPTWKHPAFGDIMKWKITGKVNTNLPSDSKELDKALPVHEISDDEIQRFCSDDTTNKIKIIWIGHATNLVSIDNFIIITDPVFSDRCSPIQLFGPKRFRPTPITIERIPRIDAVLISHNHFDHLDYNSVCKINEIFGKDIHWFVGSGLASWFKSIFDARVYELSWWQKATVKNLQFSFVPAQHWSRRGINDVNKTLWGGWVVTSPTKKFYFAGDSGYCEAFKEIGKVFGPIDLSAIPIGAYEPRWVMEPQHVDPEQAVQIHMDVKSKKSIGIHWGTFVLTDEFYLEPKSKLAEALGKYSLDPTSFITLEHGRSCTV